MLDLGRNPHYCNEKYNVFFSETRPLLGHFLKKVFFAPKKCQTLVKIFKIQKSAKNGQVWDPPPFFSPKIFFYQNDSEWP